MAHTLSFSHTRRHTLNNPCPSLPSSVWYSCAQAYAIALVKILKLAEPPICVGLYARWGSGKTFMISLLLKQFDPTVREDPRTKVLRQHFEEGYDALGPPANEEASETSLLAIVWELVVNQVLGTLASLIVPSEPLWLFTLRVILSEIVADTFKCWRACMRC